MGNETVWASGVTVKGGVADLCEGLLYLLLKICSNRTNDCERWSGE